MKTRKKKAADYPVGYGKPPVHSRFVKGQSGNKKGRPKGKKNRDTIIDEVLFRPIRIQQNGKPKTVPALEAVVMKVLTNALNGDHRSAIATIQMASRSGGENEDFHAGSVAVPFDERALLRIMKDYIAHSDSPKPASNQASDGDAEARVDSEGQDL